MAQFSPVAPASILQKLQQHGTLGYYHLLIASDVLEFQTQYRQVFRNLKRVFVIVDNGLIERGASLPAAALLTAAEVVAASTIVLPDQLRSAQETARLSVTAAHELQLAAGRPLNLLAVAQGNTISEMLVCAAAILNEVPSVRYLAVPRVAQQVLGSRCEIVRKLRYAFGLSIHLLGFSDDLADDVAASCLPGVLGVDSATPIWLGLQNILLPSKPPSSNSYGPRPQDFWQQTEINQEVLDNIATARRWFDVPMSAVSPERRQTGRLQRPG